MKKFFLIPLMTLVCSVMAWGTTRQVGTLSALNTALSNASAGDVIKLTADISGSNTEYFVTWSADGVTLDLNGHLLRNTYAYGYAAALYVPGVTMQITNSSATVGTISCPNYALWVDEANVTVHGNVNFTGYVNLADGWSSDAYLTFSSDYSGIVTSADVTPATEYIHYTLEEGCSGKFSTAFKTAVQSSLAEGQSFVQDGDYWVLGSGEVKVAQIGSTTYPTLAAAVEAATSGQTITLLEDVAEEVTITKSVTLAGNKTISRPLHLNGNITFTMAGVTIDAAGYSYGIRLDGNNNTYVINVANGSTNTIAAQIGIGGFNSNPTLTISGNGTLNVNAQTTLANMVSATVTAANLKANISGGQYGKIANAVTTVSLQAGQYTIQPTAAQIAEGYSAIKVVSTGYYSVVDNSTVVAIYKDDLFSSLADALNAASADAMANVTLVKNVSESITINKNTVIYTNGYSVANSVAAGSGYARIQAPMFGDVVLFLKNDLAAFIATETATYEPAEDVDLSDLGGYVPVWGNKTLILNEGITLTLKYAGNYPTLAVQNGATLTIKGKGTIATDKDAIKVENGGTLIIGEENSDDQINITTSVRRQQNFAIRNAGQTTIYNANIDGMSGVLFNSSNGKVDIKGGRYVGHSTSTDVDNYGWTYAINNCGTMTIKNAFVQGIHGAVACRNAKGTLELQNCDLRALDENNIGGVHYALYVSTNAIVSAYDTKFYSENANNTILIGDDDVHNTFGLIYLYGGCKTNRKMYVQQKKGQDDDLLFPVLVSTESAWYSAALNGGFGPLPANIEYQAISETIGGLTYSFGTHSTATDQKEIDSNEATIPWQQATTWSDDAVPETTTAVVIPEGKVVVVSKDETNKEAVAEQVFLGDGAKLTVETGTTLTVGEGGVNIANGGQLVVEPGAVVTVGAAGLVTTEEEALVIEYSGENSGVFMIAPEVTENTQPKAMVKMYSKAYKIADNNFRWQHFAIPTVGAPEEFTMPVATAVYYLDYNDPTTPWKTIGAVANMNTPFQGYNLTNWAAAPGTEYTFYGNIIGNGDGKMPFVGTGYNFCGNSYTAPIDIALMLQDIKNNPNVDVEPTINIYDTENDRYEPITKASLDAAGWMGTPVTTQIAPMQGFFLNLRTNTSGDIEVINYSNSVWGNPSISTGASLAPKRAAADDSKGIKMIVSANDRQDNVLMLEKAEYSAAFDDDADASKMMSEHSFNLWANIDNAAQSIVATNDLENTILGFQTVEGGEFTISFKANNMDDEYMLLDITTGEKMAIAEGAQYTFTQESNVKNAARFEIVKIAKMPTSIENVETTAKAKGIYTITGQFVGRDYNNLPKGVYVIDGQKIVK